MMVLEFIATQLWSGFAFCTARNRDHLATSAKTCFMGMHLHGGMHLIGGTAQKVGINGLDNRRVGHSDSFNISIKCRVISS
jgi:hypothetical protein